MKEAALPKQNSTDNNLETTSKDVVGAINEINSDLGGITEVKTEVLDGVKATSKFIQYNKNIVDISNEKYYVKTYEVDAGNKLRVSGNGRYFLCVFTNDSNEAVESYPSTYTASDTQYDNQQLTVPVNATKVVVSGYAGADYIQAEVIREKGLGVKGLSELRNDVDGLLEFAKIIPSVTEVVSANDEANKYIKYDGIVTDIQNANFHVSTYTDVVIGEELLIYGSAIQTNYKYAFYDSNNVFICGKRKESSENDVFNEYVVVPNNASKLCVSYVKSVTHGFCIEKVKSKTTDTHNWSSLNWSIIGDSLSAMNDASCKHYFDFIKDRTSINVTNYSEGGTGYKWQEANNKAFYQVANRIADSDIITIFGSGNDTRSELTLGTYTDRTTDTVAGCVNVTLDNLFSRFPKAHIGIISPTPWANSPTTTINNTLEQYSEMLKRVAEYRGIPYLELYHHSGLRPEDLTQARIYYSDEVIDGHSQAVHPNNKGQHFLYPKFLKFIEGMIG